MKLFVLAALMMSSFAFGCGEDGSGFFPKNNLRIPVGAKLSGGLSENSFNDVIDEIEHVMAPMVKAHGGKLSIVRNWTDEEVNAFATRTGDTWNVEMFGGLARHPEITEDGFKLVLCHEIGHHLGGAPVKAQRKWASAEGQADYWATLKCLRQVYLHDKNAEIIKGKTVPAGIKEACLKAHHDSNDQAICIRSALSGESVANLFASLEGSIISFSSPDKTKVPKTFEGHPAAQCRLDTFFQGTLCTVDYREETSLGDEVKGTCHTSLGHKIGTRPLCWYNYVRK